MVGWIASVVAGGSLTKWIMGIMAGGVVILVLAVAVLDGKRADALEANGALAQANRDLHVDIKDRDDALFDWEVQWNLEAERQAEEEDIASERESDRDRINTDNRRMRAELTRLRNADPEIKEFGDIPIPGPVLELLRGYAFVTAAVGTAPVSTEDRVPDSP